MLWLHLLLIFLVHTASSIDVSVEYSQRQVEDVGVANLRDTQQTTLQFLTTEFSEGVFLTGGDYSCTEPFPSQCNSSISNCSLSNATCTLATHRCLGLGTGTRLELVSNC
jgi:hypothetical protein